MIHDMTQGNFVFDGTDWLTWLHGLGWKMPPAARISLMVGGVEHASAPMEDASIIVTSGIRIFDPG